MTSIILIIFIFELVIFRFLDNRFEYVLHGMVIILHPNFTKLLYASYIDFYAAVLISVFSYKSNMVSLSLLTVASLITNVLIYFRVSISLLISSLT